MWRWIKIRNYRSIEHVVVELAPFTVVVGPNGSGKSNFADAFVFARDIANDASTAVQNRGGIAGVRRWRTGRPADVYIELAVAATREELYTDYAYHLFTLTSKREGQWGFKQESIGEVVGSQHSLSMERNRHGAKLHVPNEQQWDEHELDVSETTSAMLLVRQLVRFQRAAGLRNVRRYRLNPETMRQPQLATERTRLDESGANIAVAIRSLRQKKAQWDSVLLAMRKLVPGLVDISDGALGRYLGVQFFQRQASGEVAEFAATEMSEGAMRALGILVAAQQMSRDELLILEEPEVSIHPGAAAVLFEFLKQASRRGAVLLTTHSAELLDAAKDEEILVCDYRDGVTHVGPMEREQRRLVEDGLLSAAELMRSEPLRIEGMPPDVIPHEETR